MGGESLDAVDVEPRGLVGDRAYAVVDGDGKLATGKHSRRFRRRDEVFEFSSRTTPDGVVVRGRGEEWAAPGDDLDRALTEAMGDDVRVLPETTTPFFDAGAVSLVGTASLRWCAEPPAATPEGDGLRRNVGDEPDGPSVEELGTGALRIGGVGLSPV